MFVDAQAAGLLRRTHCASDMRQGSLYFAALVREGVATAFSTMDLSMSYEQELLAGIEAVSLAAKVCQSVQSQITQDVLEKKDKSPVTVADYGSQAVVCRALASAFPNDPIVG